MYISERVWNLTRMLWMRDVESLGRKWDALAPRFVEEPATGGPTEGQFTPPEAAQQMLDYYYEQRGWDENGIPTPETLERMGLAELMEAVDIPPELVAGVIRDGELVSETYRPEDGETVRVLAIVGGRQDPHADSDRV